MTLDCHRVPSLWLCFDSPGILETKRGAAPVSSFSDGEGGLLWLNVVFGRSQFLPGDWGDVAITVDEVVILMDFKRVGFVGNRLNFLVVDAAPRVSNFSSGNHFSAPLVLEAFKVHSVLVKSAGTIWLSRDVVQSFDLVFASGFVVHNVWAFSYGFFVKSGFDFENFSADSVESTLFFSQGVEFKGEVILMFDCHYDVFIGQKIFLDWGSNGLEILSIFRELNGISED